MDFLPPCFRSGNLDLVFKIRVLKNKFLQDFNFDNSFVKMNFKEIQILISWISFSTVLLRFAKLFSSWSFLRALSLRVGDRCSWEQFFSNPFSADFPIKPKERKSKDIFLSVQIRVLILRFVANPKSGFLNQNPDFPIGHVWCLLRTRDFSLIWHPVLTWRWIKMAQR